MSARGRRRARRTAWTSTRTATACCVTGRLFRLVRAHEGAHQRTLNVTSRERRRSVRIGFGSALRVGIKHHEPGGKR